MPMPVLAAVLPMPMPMPVLAAVLPMPMPMPVLPMPVLRIRHLVVTPRWRRIYMGPLWRSMRIMGLRWRSMHMGRRRADPAASASRRHAASAASPAASADVSVSRRPSRKWKPP